KGQWSWSLADSDGRWRRAMAVDGWGRESGDGWLAGGGGWLDMDMWHSMLALEGVALCVILIFFNDIIVKLGTTFWSLALC
ncbi:unnamed protein product, partial [Prunus brigantina]